MKYRETERKIKGQWFTPEHIADAMVKMTPADWWSKGILEPTSGNGNLVIRILDEKVNHGLTPEEALSSTFANELDAKYANDCTERVRKWAKQRGIQTTWVCMNEDAMSYDFSDIPYDYVWTNLPFGCYGGCSSRISSMISENVVKSEAILITKPTAFRTHVKEYKIVDFPGIAYKCQISHYDVSCSESKSWIDKYEPLMADRCKWVVQKDDNYTHVIRISTSSRKFLSYSSRAYYDNKGKLPIKCVLLRLSAEECEKLDSYQNHSYEDYLKEMNNYTICRDRRLIYGYINAALKELAPRSVNDTDTF